MFDFQNAVFKNFLINNLLCANVAIKLIEKKKGLLLAWIFISVILLNHKSLLLKDTNMPF